MHGVFNKNYVQIIRKKNNIILSDDKIKISIKKTINIQKKKQTFNYNRCDFKNNYIQLTFVMLVLLLKCFSCNKTDHNCST